MKHLGFENSASTQTVYVMLIIEHDTTSQNTGNVMQFREEPVVVVFHA